MYIKVNENNFNVRRQTLLCMYIKEYLDVYYLSVQAGFRMSSLLSKKIQQIMGEYMAYATL